MVLVKGAIQDVIKRYIGLKEFSTGRACQKIYKFFLRNCVVCQQCKYETTAPPDLLQPLPIPEAVWTDISMDFIDGLPPSFGKSVILVIVDRFSKAAHFLALRHPYTASSVTLFG